MNKETLRMQLLAGVITENQYKQKLNEIQFNDDEKALGILIVPNHEDDEDDDFIPYLRDYEAYVSLLKGMGYSQEQIDDDLDEYFHYTSAFNEEEMNIYRSRTGIENLKPEDVTIGMIKDELRDEFGDPQ